MMKPRGCKFWRRDGLFNLYHAPSFSLPLTSVDPLYSVVFMSGNLWKLSKYYILHIPLVPIGLVYTLPLKSKSTSNCLAEFQNLLKLTLKFS